MKNKHFYQIEKPSTQQIFEAIINDEYTPLEKIKPKAKQIKVLLKDYYGANEIFVTFSNVTNSGGVPYFLADNGSLHELALEIHDDFYEMSKEEQDHVIELLGCYLQEYDKIFNP